MFKANGITNKRKFGYLITIGVIFTGCSPKKVNYADAVSVTDSAKQQVFLPAPFETKSVRN